MKKSRNNATYFATGIENASRSLCHQPSVPVLGERCFFRTSELLETQHELEIIYANIRV
ncbi:hypothetical protein [Flavobacterium longum]|uniref:hypothetical protein n=1 Tax=Flavobacterium longum TaxID=1299340 RepID=UPI0039ED7598